MLNRIADRRFYFGLVAIFLFVCLALLILYPTGKSFFIINGIHHPAADTFFYYFTYLGDGITVVVIAVLLALFYRVSAGLVSLAGLLLCGLTVSLLKNYVFIENQRPKLFFWGNKMIHYIDGVYINIEHSFPSGHSLTAFFCFTFMVLLRLGNTVLNQVIFALAAILAAYSRVYLAHHFVGDIFAGACMGVVYAFIAYAVYNRIKNGKGMQYSLLSYLKK